MSATAAGLAVTATVAACTPPEPTPAPANSAAAEGSGYADGRYSADGHYGGLPSSIGVTVTLDDGVITDVVVAPHATDPTSLDLQNRFAEAVPAVVVGRAIDDVKVDRIAGSSSTPDGFNTALERIKAEAAAAGRTS